MYCFRQELLYRFVHAFYRPYRVLIMVVILTGDYYAFTSLSVKP